MLPKMAVEVIEYRHGRLMYLPNDTCMGRFLREYGEYSEDEVKLYAQILRPGDIVVEVGANIGCLTVPIAKLVGPTGAVFALEPQLFLYYLLCGNIALNGLRNVNATNLAAGHTDGAVFVPEVDYTQNVNFGGISLSKYTAGRQVGCLALDGLATKFSSLRLLKVDVEGMEKDVLLGAAELIQRTRPFIYIEDDRPEHSLLLRRIIRSYGYRMFWHKPLYVTAPDRPEDLLGLVSFNLFCAPVESSCQIEMEEVE